MAGKVVERGGVDNGDGFEGVVGGIIVEVVVGDFLREKGMSLMFRFYSVYIPDTSFLSSSFQVILLRGIMLESK